VDQLVGQDAGGEGAVGVGIRSREISAHRFDHPAGDLAPGRAIEVDGGKLAFPALEGRELRPEALDVEWHKASLRPRWVLVPYDAQPFGLLGGDHVQVSVGPWGPERPGRREPAQRLPLP